MTREEAIIILKCVMPDSSIRLAARDEEIKEAMNMAIKALEEQQNPNSIRINFVGEKEAKEFDEYLKNQQESVLDKIRVEIKNKENELGFKTSEDVAMKSAYIQVLKIIDKYKSESEDKK